MIDVVSIQGNISNEGQVTGDVSNQGQVIGSLFLNKSDTPDYNLVTNKPKLNGETLVGNKSLSDVGVKRLTNSQINDIFNA